MLHRGFNKRENWLKNGYQHVKASQTEMIKRAYPDYDQDNDWVLWIVPDLFHNREFMKLVGEIEVKKKDGSVLEIPHVVRTPYYNKKLHQISLVPGDKRKRIFGVPLVFHSFEELEEISEVYIKWNIYAKCALDDKIENFVLHLLSVRIHYRVSFLKNTVHPELRVFTIHSNDYSSTSDLFKENEELKAEYLNEFDMALSANCSIELLINDEFETVILNPGIYINHSTADSNESCLSDDVTKRLVSLSDGEKGELKEFLKQMYVEDEVEFSPDYLEKEEILTAEFMADLIPEPGFGFKEV